MKMMTVFFIMLCGLIVGLGVVIDHAFKTKNEINYLESVIQAIKDQQYDDLYRDQSNCLNLVNAYNVLAEANHSSVPLRSDSDCGPSLSPPTT